MDLINILKHCPKGTKLYSPIYGDCKLNEVDDLKDYEYPIVVDTPRRHYTFTKEGKYILLGNGECCLFPSRDQRDWSKFRLPCKRGDIMMTSNSVFIVCKVDEGLYPTAYCGLTFEGIFKITNKSFTYTTDFYYPATEDARDLLMKFIDNAGYVWNPETCNLEHKLPAEIELDINCREVIQNTSCGFKPFDKVLVKKQTGRWGPAFFYEETEDGYYKTIDGRLYTQCILYKGNEHLINES